MPVSAEAVASLRARTGVSILECKKALEEANGDEEKAIEILRKRGIASAAKKADRGQSEGGIFVAQKNDLAGLVELKCETDFVARGDAYQALGQELADTLLAKGMDAAKKLADEKIPDAGLKLGENISVGQMQLIEGKVIGVYVHSNRKIAVVIGLDGGTGDLAKDVAMHAAAMNPLYVSPDEVEESVLVKERDIWKDQLAKEGKPEQIMIKIMEGKERKFRDENALIMQDFVKDPSKKIKDHLGTAKVATYLRVAI